jgi:hypothetical protein
MVVLMAWAGAALGGGGVVVAGLLVVVPIIPGVGVGEGGCATMVVLMVVLVRVVRVVSLLVAVAGLGKRGSTMMMMMIIRVVNLGVAVTMIRAVEWGTIARTRAGMVARARLAIGSLSGTEIGGRVLTRRGIVGRGIQLLSRGAVGTREVGLGKTRRLLRSVEETGVLAGCLLVVDCSGRHFAFVALPFDSGALRFLFNAMLAFMFDVLIVIDHGSGIVGFSSSLWPLSPLPLSETRPLGVGRVGERIAVGLVEANRSGRRHVVRLRIAPSKAADMVFKECHWRGHQVALSHQLLAGPAKELLNNHPHRPWVKAVRNAIKGNCPPVAD